jgi:hypothetical protein
LLQPKVHSASRVMLMCTWNKSIKCTDELPRSPHSLHASCVRAVETNSDRSRCQQ